MAAPARRRNSLFKRLFGGRRRPALPLPVHSSVELSAWNSYKKSIGCVILEEIMQYTLSYLRSIEEDLVYWRSKARGSYSQTMYFMILQRGPGAFVEATCPRLTRLGNNGGPSQGLLKSAYNIISTNIDVLTSIKRCLAAFLAKVYQQADIYKEGLTGSHCDSLYTLIIILNHVFPKLEELHRKAGGGQTLLFTHDGNPCELQFKRLREVDINSSQWTDAFSANAIGLIYQNLETLDNMFSALIVSVGEGPLEAMKRTDKPVMEKQYARQTEESLRRIVLSFFEKLSKALPQHASGEVLMEIQRSILELDQVAKANTMDLQEAILGLDQILKASKTSFALLTFGIPLLLFFRVLTWVQSAEGRRNIGELLVLAQRRFMDFKMSSVTGEADEVMWRFGLMLYSLDRLYEVVELHGNQSDEWTSLKECIFCPAKPSVAMEDKLDALFRLKRT